MPSTLLVDCLRRGLIRGNVRVIHADGSLATYGNAQGPELTLRFLDRAAERALALDPALKLGELYADGRLELEQGDCYDLIAMVKRNARSLATWPALGRHVMRHAGSWFKQRQTEAVAKHNIAHHYDLDERFYRLFLDDDLQYTCAYFEAPGQSLEAAQLAKKRHVAAKLLLEPGQRVLDIGSGWGGLCLYLASVAGAQATGVTLSRPQYEVAVRRAAERGLSERAQFLLSDYRKVTGTFDRIVSVGMFEAIGLGEFDVFFRTVTRLLDRKGVMVLHSIGRTKPRAVPSPWIEKYIFPGSYIPALSEVLPALERAGLLVTDTEILRVHYADTLREWRRRFLSRRAEVLELYDERFLRLWEFYLASSEAGFRIDRLFIFQMQLTRHQDTVPRCRNYMAEQAAALAQAETQIPEYALPQTDLPRWAV